MKRPLIIDVLLALGVGVVLAVMLGAFVGLVILAVT